MRTEIFYDIIDNELNDIIVKYKDDDILQKHKNDEQKKGYAFLIWFIEFYGQKIHFKNYITEGNDDFSCDIIFSKKNIYGEETFYVIQSKWKNKSNSSKSIEAKEIKATLNDFELISAGNRNNTTNQEFKNQQKRLLAHLENNGEVKFIFVTLGLYNSKAEENINAFRKGDPKTKFEFIDINNIKRQFIEREYKKIKISNPLEFNYNPEETKIKLKIERIADKTGRDLLEFDREPKGYIFIVKPQTIYELFNYFGFSLFFKNVRNPLPSSNYNKQIVETLLKRPSKFWYFNNVITAISKIIPTIGQNASEIEITGLQIINGAQTVFSIFTAYQNATATQREIINNDAQVTFRLIKSSDEDFNLEITKYTNSQNQIYPRDFRSNDEIQVKLQNDFFENTNIWYEKRRGEFRVKSQQLPTDVNIISNELFAQTYLAYKLQDPISAKNKKKQIFIKKNEDVEGLYDKIFTLSTAYEDIFVSYILFVYVEEKKKEFLKKEDFDFLNYATFHFVSLLGLSIQDKYPNYKELINQITNLYKKNKLEELDVFYNFIIEKVKNYLNLKLSDKKFTFANYFKNSDSYLELKLLIKGN